MNLDQLLASAEKKACELNPYLHDKAIELVKLAYNNGYQIIITQGYRSIAEQDALYAQGRTKPGPIVTNARGGSSNHNYRLAFDIAVLNYDGSIDWNTESKYKAIGGLGQSIGLDWGGAWVSFTDLPHFEYVYGLSISQLKSGASIPDYPADYNPNKVLGRGDKGAFVQALQNKLCAIGFSLTCDGDFGPGTEKVVKEVQGILGLTVDGKVGPITMGIIDKVIENRKVGYVMNIKDADQVLAILSNYWKQMDGNKGVQDYVHYLANEVRKAAGISVE